MLAGTASEMQVCFPCRRCYTLANCPDYLVWCSLAAGARPTSVTRDAAVHSNAPKGDDSMNSLLDWLVQHSPAVASEREPATVAASKIATPDAQAGSSAIQTGCSCWYSGQWAPQMEMTLLLCLDRSVLSLTLMQSAPTRCSQHDAILAVLGTSCSNCARTLAREAMRKVPTLEAVSCQLLPCINTQPTRG